MGPGVYITRFFQILERYACVRNTHFAGIAEFRESIKPGLFRRLWEGCCGVPTIPLRGSFRNPDVRPERLSVRSVGALNMLLEGMPTIKFCRISLGFN